MIWYTVSYAALYTAASAAAAAAAGHTYRVAATSGEQTWTVRFRVRQLGVVVLVIIKRVLATDRQDRSLIDRNISDVKWKAVVSDEEDSSFAVAGTEAAGSPYKPTNVQLNILNSGTANEGHRVKSDFINFLPQRSMQYLAIIK